MKNPLDLARFLTQKNIDANCYAFALMCYYLFGGEVYENQDHCIFLLDGIFYDRDGYYSFYDRYAYYSKNPEGYQLLAEQSDDIICEIIRAMSKT